MSHVAENTQIAGMKNRFIVTPFFMDEAWPQLERLALVNRQVNKASPGEGSQMERMAAIHQGLADEVFAVAANGDRPVSIAADCCTAIGVLAGLQRAGIEPALIWFDAHGDFNTWETTPSGFVGGMPLAMMVGRGEQTLVEAAGMKKLAEDRVVLADGRDLDPGERAALEGSAVRLLSDVGMLLEEAPPEGPLYVHFDVDVLDPADAPAMGYPTAGGPSAGRLAEVFGRLAASGRVVAVSMSSWNPKLDRDGRSARVCMNLLGVLLSA